MKAPRSGARLRSAKPYTLVQGDCLAALAAMPLRAFDVILTDPPYSEHVHTRGRRTVLPDAGTRPSRLELVALFSDPGELVGDPFAGSGTTGVASLRLGRRFWGAELDASHAETARARLDAESAHSTLEAARGGQLRLFGRGTG